MFSNPLKNVKIRLIRLKYREYGSGDSSIQFPSLENGISKKKISILGSIEKKLATPTVYPPTTWPPS